MILDHIDRVCMTNYKRELRAARLRAESHESGYSFINSQINHLQAKARIKMEWPKPEVKR